MALNNQTISSWALAILAIPLLVLTASELILGFWGDRGLTVPTVFVEEPVRLELIARYKTLAAFVFFAAVALAVTAIFVWDVWRHFAFWSQIRIVAALGLAILVTLVFSVIEPEQLKSFETYHLLGEDVFRGALEQARTGACFPDRTACETGTAFDAMVALVDLSNHIVSLAATCALVGVILALAHCPPSSAPLAQKAECLRRARRVAKRYLYCTGVLLTAGMIWVQAWMSWPATLIAAGDARDQFLDLVNAFALYRGTTFTLLILSVYLPVVLVLAARFEDLWDAVPDDPELSKDSALERISYTDALKAVTAIVAPILMGVIGSTWSVSFGL
jgi:hypothetical protein